MDSILNLTIQQLLRPEGFSCNCGRRHLAAPLKVLKIEPGCIEKTPQALKEAQVKKPFVVMGPKAKLVAGDRVLQLLRESGIDYGLYCFEQERILPNEEALQQIESALEPDCDLILAVGSGVMNDLCKMVASSHKLDSGIIATAPSMDGYASNSSAMELKGVKTTVYTTCPMLIICDTEIMRKAPEIMLRSGFGDMAAKLISIAEWQIAHLITGEYYCDSVAQLMLSACRKVLESADDIMQRKELAVRRMTEGLVLSGIAMSFAGVSRPASGMEHTISHILEMFALASGKQPAPHGIQVAYGLRIALKLYEAAYEFSPSPEKHREAFSRFDQSVWSELMSCAFGQQAQELIQAALAEGRNSRENTDKRFEAALKNWPEIKKIIGGVKQQQAMLEGLLDSMGLPKIEKPESMGYTMEEAENAVRFSRDLRSRYIFTSLCWDIGLSTYSDKLIEKYCSRA